MHQRTDKVRNMREDSMDTHTDDAAPRLAQWTALHDALAERQTPPGVENALMRAFAEVHQPLPWYRRLLRRRPGAMPWPAMAGVCATACAVLLMLAAVHGDLALAPGAAQRMAPAVLAMQAGGDFIALESAERIRSDPDPHLVSANLPRNVLAQMGLPVALDNANDGIRADMLVGADGAPLAVRLVLN